MKIAMKKSPFDIIINLLVSEKSALLKAKNQYAFKVSPAATKLEIAAAVKEIYNVEVKAVNTMNYVGKPKRAGRSPKQGRRSSWAKAIVTLADGNSIEMA